jgi:hypothetical protein
MLTLGLILAAFIAVGEYIKHDLRFRDKDK